MKKSTSLIAATLLLAASGSAFSASNVALGKNVSLDGIFGLFGWGNGMTTTAASVTDGTFLGNGHQWDLDSIWWDANHPGATNNKVEIDLGGNYQLNGFVLEADNNDVYRVEYFSGGIWHTAWDAPMQGSWGMESRSATLGSDITTSKLRLRAMSGDGFYSVSEFQASGVQAPVPEPETYAMMLAGLGLVAVAARKRSN